MSIRDDWRRWKMGARIHPGWTPLCFFAGIVMFRDWRLGLLVGLTMAIPIVLTCAAVYRANYVLPALAAYAYAGEDDDIGGTKPSDPDGGAGDDE